METSLIYNPVTCTGNYCGWRLKRGVGKGALGGLSPESVEICTSQVGRARI